MRIAFKIATLVLLAVIGLEVEGACCDPVGVLVIPQISSASPAPPGDPCSETCVPDCFCCSTTLAPDQVAAAETLRLLPDVLVSPDSRLIPGTSLVPDHVPKSVL